MEGSLTRSTPDKKELLGAKHLWQTIMESCQPKQPYMAEGGIPALVFSRSTATLVTTLMQLSPSMMTLQLLPPHLIYVCSLESSSG